MNDLISIVMPLFNCAAFVKEALESVVCQTYSNWEMLITDDGSTDSSADIVQCYVEKDKRITLLRSNERFGPATSRNRAIKEARGRYIALLDSDDVWLPEKLKKQLDFMKEKKATLSYTSYEKMDEEGIARGIVQIDETVNYRRLLRSNIIACSSAIYDSKKTGKRYMAEGLSTQEDYTLWLDILRSGNSAYGLNEPLMKYRVRKESVSRNKIRTAKDQWYIYRKKEKMPLLKSIYYFAHYVHKSVRKYSI
ncbi:MAG: glycosyltransferase [Candidatus Omnitrophica bacterium]|nr:glycosyltransferase [Candidatus Omnitrophota bacterium]